MAMDLDSLSELVNKAKKVQKRVEELRAELATKTVEATAGGGMVKVVASGAQEIVSIDIERQVINPDEAEMLCDLVTAAVNEALKKSQALMSGNVDKLTEEFKVSDLLN